MCSETSLLGASSDMKHEKHGLPLFFGWRGAAAHGASRRRARARAVGVERGRGGAAADPGLCVCPARVALGSHCILTPPQARVRSHLFDLEVTAHFWSLPRAQEAGADPRASYENHTRAPPAHLQIPPPAPPTARPTASLSTMKFAAACVGALALAGEPRQPLRCARASRCRQPIVSSRPPATSRRADQLSGRARVPARPPARAPRTKHLPQPKTSPTRLPARAPPSRPALRLRSLRRRPGTRRDRHRARRRPLPRHRRRRDRPQGQPEDALRRARRARRRRHWRRPRLGGHPRAHRRRVCRRARVAGHDRRGAPRRHRPPRQDRERPRRAAPAAAARPP
jgi:hypothetical protein